YMAVMEIRGRCLLTLQRRIRIIELALLALLFFGTEVVKAGSNQATISPHNRRRDPGISITASTTRVSAGNVAQFILRTSKVDGVSDLIVNYSLSGTAVPSVDYSLDSFGRITIPAGTATASIALNTLSSGSSTNRVATLRLQSGTRYKISTPS